MKALLILTVALAFQGPGTDGLPGPYVQSRIVEICNQGLLIDSDPEPDTVTIQSARAANGEYFLLLEVVSRDWTMPHSGKIYFSVNRRPLALPCFIQSSRETVGT